jgi:CheY-like chemotaxis protein
VDDDPDTRDLLAFQLESRGFRVTRAGSGREALTLARQERPDLITLDVMMPGLDGFETLAALKQEERTANIPVVMLSVLPEEERGFALGAADYLPKPPDPDQFVQSIRAVLDDGNGPSTGAERTLEGLRVLVVDDEPDLVGWLRTALSAHGLQVLPAYGGQEGLDKARTERPDVIVLDVQMPDLTGTEVIRALKADPTTATIPVIIMTASDIDKRTARARMIGLGAAELLGKPFSVETLVSEILRHTDLLPTPPPIRNGR